MICASPKYYSGDKIKNNERGWACDRYEREENFLQSFDGATLMNDIT